MNTFLKAQVPHGEFFHIDQIANTDEAQWLPRSPVSCYSGHVGYGFTRRLPDNLVVFTVLRDPVDRAISMYYYFRSLPRSYLQEVLPGMRLTHDVSLPEFIRVKPKMARACFGNMQTAMLSWSDAPYSHRTEWKPPDLSVARDNLGKCLVGLTERLADSLHCLCCEFGWDTRQQVPQENKTPNRPRADSLDAETRAWFEEHTSLDAELYRFGQELFHSWFERVTKQAA